LKDIKPLRARFGFVAALQLRHMGGFMMHVQTILHGPHASHRGNLRDQLIDFIDAHRAR